MTGFAPTGSAPTASGASAGGGGGSTVYTLTLVPGAFHLTGTGETVTDVRHLTLTPGSFALAGSTALLVKGKLLNVSSGTFRISGATAAITRPLRMSLTPGSFVRTGQSALLVYGYLLNESVGHFNLTGQPASLTPVFNAGTHNIVLANPGTYTLAGPDVSLSDKHVLSAASGTFHITAGTETYNIGVGVILQPGSFTLAGAITMKAPRKLPLVAASFALAPVANKLKVGHKLTRVTGSFTLTGIAAGLPAPGYVLTLVPGKLSFLPTPLPMHVVRRLPETPGSFALGGTAARIYQPRTMPARPGTFNLLGQGQIGIGRRLTGSGNFALSGKPVTALLTRRLRLVPASFGLAAGTLSAKRSRVATAAPGTFVLTGVASQGRQVTPPVMLGSGSFALGGTVATLARTRRVITVTPGSFLLTGTWDAPVDSGDQEGLYNDIRWIAVSTVTPLSAIEPDIHQGSSAVETLVP